MPNWCQNKLAVTGTKEKVLNFLDESKNGKFLFNNYLPMPQTFIDYDTTNKMARRDEINYETKEPLFSSDEEYKKYCDGYKAAVEYQKEKYGVVGWYDWRRANYGTKWDICDLEAPIIEDLKAQILVNGNDDETTIIIEFDTAWSPCIAFVENIYKRYPELIFRLTWIETGAFFCGAADFWFDDGEPCVEIEEGVPRLATIDDLEEISEKERKKMEEENGFDDFEGFGVLYDYINPFEFE